MPSAQAVSFTPYLHTPALKPHRASCVWICPGGKDETVRIPTLVETQLGKHTNSPHLKVRECLQPGATRTANPDSPNPTNNRSESCSSLLSWLRRPPNRNPRCNLHNHPCICRLAKSFAHTIPQDGADPFRESPQEKEQVYSLQVTGYVTVRSPVLDRCGATQDLNTDSYHPTRTM